MLKQKIWHDVLDESSKNNRVIILLMTANPFQGNVIRVIRSSWTSYGVGQVCNSDMCRILKYMLLGHSLLFQVLDAEVD